MSARLLRRKSLGISSLKNSIRFFLYPSKQDVAIMRERCITWGVPSFSSYDVLLRAFTHKSLGFQAAKQLNIPASTLTLDSLEFLGDRVISHVVAPRDSRTLVGNAGFAHAARQMGLTDLIRCFPAQRNEPRVLANAYEAIAAAVYLDGGLNAARAFVDTTLLSIRSDVYRINHHLGFHTESLNHILRKHFNSLFYLQTTEIRLAGPSPAPNSSPECPTFTVLHLCASCRLHVFDPSVRLLNARSPAPARTWPLAQGFGTSSKLARTDTAIAALTILRHCIAQQHAGANSNVSERTAHHAALDLVGWLSNNPPGSSAYSAVLDCAVASGSDNTGSSVLQSRPRRLSPTRERSGACAALRAAWRGTHGALCVQSVHACLGAVGRADLADALCVTVAGKVRTMAHSPETLEGIADVAEIGLTAFNLWLSERAYHLCSMGKGEIAEMEARLKREQSRSMELAVAMGGPAKRVEESWPRRRRQVVAPLVARPGRKCMLYVVLGIVARDLGWDLAQAWLKGAWTVLQEKYGGKEHMMETETTGREEESAHRSVGG